MKKLIFTLALFLGFGLVFNSTFAQSDAAPVLNLNGQNTEESVDPPLTVMRLLESEHAFGTIVQGDKVSHTFDFVNDGDHDLIIENVKPSCGCTAPSWPREAIKPGETGQIQMVFNSTGKMGNQHKFLTITYNGNPRIERLAFTGNIIPKGDQPVKVAQPGAVQNKPAVTTPVKVVPTNPEN